jgi:hypothetical protein
VSRTRVAVVTLLVLLLAVPLWAAEESTEELAKKTQNPVADLISVPFQNNFNFGVGPNNVTQYVLNVQPVIPFKLTEDWNLITRTILPIINQPSPAPGVESAFGLGDLNPTLFLSPRKPGALIGVSGRPSRSRRRRTASWAPGSGARARQASC